MCQQKHHSFFLFLPQGNKNNANFAHFSINGDVKGLSELSVLKHTSCLHLTLRYAALSRRLETHLSDDFRDLHNRIAAPSGFTNCKYKKC